MGVALFKDGAWKVHDENTFTDRLNEGWSLSDAPKEHPASTEVAKEPQRKNKKRSKTQKGYGR